MDLCKYLPDEKIGGTYYLYKYGFKWPKLHNKT